MNVGKLLETVNSLVPLNYAFDDDFVGLTVGSEAVSYTHLTLPTT